MRAQVRFHLLSLDFKIERQLKKLLFPFNEEGTIDWGTVSTEAKRSQIPNDIQAPSQPKPSTLSQLYVKQGIRSLYS